MIILLYSIIVVIFSSITFYNIGLKKGREEAYMEKAIEIISYGDKQIILISKEYFTVEQAQQIKDAIEKEKPIIYKPRKQ